MCMSDTAEKVSIVIPVHNGSRYIKQCLNSVMKQTYRNIEILAIDNHSSDDSVKKIKYLGKLDSRIKLLVSKKKVFHLLEI